MLEFYQHNLGSFPMTPELISALEVILYTIIAVGTILAGVGLWVAFNQDKLSD